MGQWRIEFATPGSAIRHVTNCATWPGKGADQTVHLFAVRFSCGIAHLYIYSEIL